MASRRGMALAPNRALGDGATHGGGAIRHPTLAYPLTNYAIANKPVHSDGQRLLKKPATVLGPGVQLMPKRRPALCIA